MVRADPGNQIEASSMKPRRGRLVAAIAGAAVLLVAGLLAMEWREVQVRYHIWRLDQAKTLDEARPWIHALIRDSTDLWMCKSIAWKLGSGHQISTFWVFSLFPHLQDNDVLQEELDFLPLMREVWNRLESDESLLALWAHFLRWESHRTIRESLSQFQNRPNAGQSQAPVLMGTQFDIASELSFKWSFFEYIGALWLLGMDDRPKCMEFDPKVDPLPPWEYFSDLGDRLNKWIENHRDGFRFDSALGRYCLPGSPDAPVVAVPVPTTPFPGWLGPIPSAPELPIRLR
jgi:hypothetical protein